jgi:hypothetical protein
VLWLAAGAPVERSTQPTGDSHQFTFVATGFFCKNPVASDYTVTKVIMNCSQLGTSVPSDGNNRL